MHLHPEEWECDREQKSLADYKKTLEYFEIFV